MEGVDAMQPERRCPWCSAGAAADASRCPACDAALAQRESIGDLVLPGLTSVDPALQAYAGQPLRIPGTSPSQGMAGGAIIAAALGGPIGLAALGGLATLAAAEYVGARGSNGGGPVDPALVGRPSEAALLAVEHLDHGGDSVEPAFGQQDPADRVRSDP